MAHTNLRPQNWPALTCVLCAALLSLVLPRADAQTNQPPAPAKEPWGRIILVGASVSAGFTEAEPFGGPQTFQFRLSRYLDAALRAPHEPVRSLANAFFFVQPENEGRKQVQQALRAAPTLVAGIDFLFWFCYGDGTTDEARAHRFEQGLKLLAPLTCPLLLGDIPDASLARDTALSPEQIPSRTAIEAANKRLKEWASTRPQVTIVPLSSILRQVAANQALTVRAHEVPAGHSRSLLQKDKLHPSTTGCAILALSAYDAFLAARPKVPATDICWDPEEVRQSALK